MIRLARPDITDEDVDAVAAVLRSGYLVQGPEVEAFEAAIADRVGVRHAIALTNCTAALHLALLASGVGPGDVVAVTAYSWLSTANVIELCGATPRFVDIDRDTFNMDPTALEQALAPGDVRAVLPVDTFGQMADRPALVTLAEAAGAVLIEDAACSLGASWDGRAAGAWGAMGCFSFHPRKAITTGEGGAVTTDDDDLATKLHALRNHGQQIIDGQNRFVLAGFNCRMTEMQAAMGRSQLRRYDQLLEGRRALAERYRQLLEGSGIVVPAPGTPERHVYQSYVVLLPQTLAGRTGEVIDALRAGRVEATIGTYHMPLTDHFRAVGGHMAGDFPATDDVAGRAISLPLWPGLSSDEQGVVAGTLRAAVQGLLSRA